PAARDHAECLRRRQPNGAPRRDPVDPGIGAANCRRGRGPPYQKGEGDPSGSPSPLDRKSTRLNSSHVSISYAVFCLKKKRNEMLEVVRQALDVFARLVLEGLYFDDLRYQHVIGCTARLSWQGRPPRGTTGQPGTQRR